MKARFLLLVLLAVGLPAVAAQQVYSWTDANGVKHFSDSPPPASVNAHKIKVRGGVTSQDATLPVVADATPKPADATAASGQPGKPMEIGRASCRERVCHNV